MKVEREGSSISGRSYGNRDTEAKGARPLGNSNNNLIDANMDNNDNNNNQQFNHGSYHSNNYNGRDNLYNINNDDYNRQNDPVNRCPGPPLGRLHLVTDDRRLIIQLQALINYFDPNDQNRYIVDTNVINFFYDTGFPINIVSNHHIPNNAIAITTTLLR